jgi:hypothetical protein
MMQTSVKVKVRIESGSVQATRQLRSHEFDCSFNAMLHEARGQQPSAALHNQTGSVVAFTNASRLELLA